VTTDAREIPLSFLLDLERERLRLCRELLQRSSSPRIARAWAAAVHDGECRVQQLAAACGGATGCGGSERAHELARAVVAALAQALAAAEPATAPLPAKLAPSAGGTAPAPAAANAAGDSSWELRVG
jgi:hypothetical protein